jgi:hypothetical protein
VTFSQFNATAAPAGVRGGEIEFRGTKGTLYLRSDGYEVVPDNLPTIEFPACTPVDRSREKAWRANARAVIGPKKEAGRIHRADRLIRPAVPANSLRAPMNVADIVVRIERLNRLSLDLATVADTREKCESVLLYVE